MTRRGFLLSSSGLLLSSAMPAVAAAYQDDVERQLRREGYQITYKKRTWLGRIRIQAMKGNRRREVVLDPSSGEILRDYTEVTNRDRASQASNEGSGSSPSGSTGEASSGEGSSPSGEPAKEPSKEPSKEPAKEPTKETAQEPAKETPKETASSPTSEPSKETPSEPSKEPSKASASEPSKETAGGTGSATEGGGNVLR